MNLKRRVYEVLEVAGEGDRASRIVDISVLTLIALNIVTLILETMPSIHDRWAVHFAYFEVTSIFLFSVEYTLRAWSCTTDPAYGSHFRGRMRYLRRPMIIIDLLAVLPFYLPVIIPGLDLRFMRAVRLMRIFRVAKIGRYSSHLQILDRVIRAKKEELLIVAFLMVILLIISSSLLYFVEHPTQPEVFSSIPAAMWWATTTLTTVGYGDLTPVTPLGRFLASIISIMGIAMFAIPTGILSAGFTEEMRMHKERRKTPRPSKAS